jgi:hypothetical protein
MNIKVKRMTQNQEKLQKVQSRFLTPNQAKSLAKDRKNIVLERVSDVKESELWPLEQIDKVLRTIRRSVLLVKRDYPDISHQAMKELLMTDQEFAAYSKIYKYSFDLISNPQLSEQDWQRATRMFTRAQLCQQGKMSVNMAGMETQVDNIRDLARPMTPQELAEVNKTSDTSTKKIN